MNSTAHIDYRTKRGISRRAANESTLQKYLRALHACEPLRSGRDTLPIARPTIKCSLSAEQYLLLLDVLDELFLLERAARFVDRKSSKIARNRLNKAIAAELEIKPELIDSLFHTIDPRNVALIKEIGCLILNSSEIIDEIKYETPKIFDENVIKFPLLAKEKNSTL